MIEFSLLLMLLVLLSLRCFGHHGSWSVAVAIVIVVVAVMSLFVSLLWWSFLIRYCLLDRVCSLLVLQCVFDRLNLVI